jgi:integrase
MDNWSPQPVQSIARNVEGVDQSLGRGAVSDSAPLVQPIAGSSQFAESLIAYLEASIAPATRAAYASDLKTYRAQGGTLPTTALAVANYLVAQAGRVAPATLARRLVAIGREHSTRGMCNPCADPLVRMTMRGIRRRHGKPPRQVEPLMAEQLGRIVERIPPTLRGRRDKALLLVGFAGSFRRSELVSLTVEQVRPNVAGLEIVLASSKTDQEHRGRVVAIPFGSSEMTCPVRALERWIAAAGISAGSLFRGITRSGCVLRNPLTPQSVALIVKTYVALLGLDARMFSGHSLRAGLVTSAAALNVSAWKIRAQTGHRSDSMVARYVRDANRFSGNAAKGLL